MPGQAQATIFRFRRKILRSLTHNLNLPPRSLSAFIAPGHAPSYIARVMILPDRFADFGAMSERASLCSVEELGLS